MAAFPFVSNNPTTSLNAHTSQPYLFSIANQSTDNPSIYSSNPSKKLPGSCYCGRYHGRIAHALPILSHGILSDTDHSELLRSPVPRYHLPSRPANVVVFGYPTHHC